MKLITKSLVVLFVASAVSSTVNAGENLSYEHLTGLLSDKQRPLEDSKRDEARKPAEIMHFAEISKEDHVLDLFSGGGWYSELFSMAVGDKGKVYAQNDSVIWRFAEKGMKKRTENNRLSNVTRLDKVEIIDMSMKDKSIDLVFTALNYHDLFFTHSARNGKITKIRDKAIDHKLALANIKRVMKDDGIFVIIDHAGIAGSGFNAPNDAHRIDPNIVKYQMKEAGFSLVEEAFYLRNPNDNLSTNVFSKEVRGKTDRFVYKFVKNN